MGEAVGAGTERHHGILIQLEEHHVQVLDAALHGHLLAQQRQIADALLAQVDVQPHHVVGPHGLFHLLEGKALHMGVAGHHFQHALGLAEQSGHILAAAGKGAGHMLALRGQLLPRVIGSGIVLVTEYLCCFEDGELVVVALILDHSLAQIGQQGGAHQPFGGRRRRGQCQNAVGALQHGVHVHLVHPRIAEDLLHTAAEGEILLDLPFKLLIQLVNGAVKGGGDGSGLKVLIAVHAGHFLHDVGLDGHVTGGAPGGHHHVHVIALERENIAQRLQLGGHILRRELLAKTAFQPAEGHVDLRFFQRHGILVHQTGDLHVGIDLTEQLHGQVESLIAALRVDGLFVAGRGLGAVVVPQGGAADALGLEVGDLQDDLVGGRQNRVLGAAHDASQTYDIHIIRDHQIIVSQCQFLAIEQRQRLTRLGTADDKMTVNMVGIIGVGGLTGGQHDVVGDVHQRIDGTHTGLPEPALHLIGGRLDIHALDLRAGQTGAALRVLHGDMEAGGVGHVPVKVGELVHGQVVQRRDLTGNAVVAPQVGAVGHGLVVDLQDDIVQVQRVGQRRTHRRVEVAQIQDDGFFLGGEQVGKTDLTGGTDHAVALHTAQLALFDLHRLALAVPAAYRAGQGHGHLHAVTQVHAAADDLLDLAAADIGLADLQLVGVGVLADLFDLTQHHIVELLGKVDGILYLHGGHSQVIGQTLQVHIRGQIDVILDPVQ